MNPEFEKEKSNHNRFRFFHVFGASVITHLRLFQKEQFLLSLAFEV